jgi:VIT1/CCC1 family predicted Fe2+/Mn2+ transporter
MADEIIKSYKRVLNPIDRVTEILFGLIMVLTFTGSFSVAEAGREDVGMMLIGALGCNLAWGIIDGIFYLISCLAEKGQAQITLRAVRNAGDPQKARQIIAAALSPLVAHVLQPDQLDLLCRQLKELPEPPRGAQVSKDDWWGALGVFLLVFLSTFPVAIPFIFMKNAQLAMRCSNAIAILILFLAGYAFGRITGRRPWLTGIYMIVLGCILVGITIALGG